MQFYNILSVVNIWDLFTIHELKKLTEKKQNTVAIKCSVWSEFQQVLHKNKQRTIDKNGTFYDQYFVVSHTETAILFEEWRMRKQLEIHFNKNNILC